jgi:two-component system, sensor histidine kinase LadS
VGDQHFALLIEGPALGHEAMSRAQQLVASGLRAAEGLPSGLVLKFQVVVAMLPDQRLDADGSLDWLLTAVNAMRSEDRKLIRALNF